MTTAEGYPANLSCRTRHAASGPPLI